MYFCECFVAKFFANAEGKLCGEFYTSGKFITLLHWASGVADYGLKSLNETRALHREL